MAISNTKLVTATFTPSASYAAGNNFGGLLTVNPNIGYNTQYQIRRVSVCGSAATLTASANLDVFILSASPTTTFTDASSVTWNSADNSNINSVFSCVGTTAANGQIANVFATAPSSTNPLPVPVTCQTDASGNLYVVIQAGGTWTMTTPAAFTILLEIAF